MLAKTVEENHRRWGVMLPKLMMAYRASVQSSIRTTPYVMVFGEHCRLPEDVYNLDGGNELAPDDHVRQLKKVLGRIHAAARRRLNEARRRQKQQYDKASRGQPFRVGGLVFLRAFPTIRADRCSKFTRPWVGPYRVVAKTSAVTYRIRHTNNRRNEQTVHFDRLKPCPNTLRLSIRKRRSPIRTGRITLNARPRTIEFRPTVIMEPDDVPPNSAPSEQQSADHRRPQRQHRMPKRGPYRFGVHVSVYTFRCGRFGAGFVSVWTFRCGFRFGAGFVLVRDHLDVLRKLCTLPSTTYAFLMAMYPAGYRTETGYGGFPPTHSSGRSRMQLRTSAQVRNES
uniref:Integrase zinc-binding domain-containing protein n=1 Tax=Trichuris muris TaxID=70415 RepID=A0A5S6QJL5_TRIMR